MYCPDGRRPRNAEATRCATLNAALERCAGNSYDDVGVRDIAGDVGVDAALLSRYFGSKDELFEAVLDSCDKGGELMSGDRATFGQRVARNVIFEPKNQTKLKSLMIFLRSISSSKAAEMIQRNARARFYGPFSEWVGGPDGVIKARLATGFIMGMAISREITGGYGLTPDECERMIKRMAAVLQDLIDN